MLDGEGMIDGWKEWKEGGPGRTGDVGVVLLDAPQAVLLMRRKEYMNY